MNLIDYSGTDSESESDSDSDVDQPAPNKHKYCQIRKCKRDKSICKYTKCKKYVCVQEEFIKK